MNETTARLLAAEVEALTEGTWETDVYDDEGWVVEVYGGSLSTCTTTLKSRSELAPFLVCAGYEDAADRIKRGA